MFFKSLRINRKISFDDLGVNKKVAQKIFELTGKVLKSKEEIDDFFDTKLSSFDLKTQNKLCQAYAGV